jgi:hypothetical protein
MSEQLREADQLCEAIQEAKAIAVQNDGKQLVYWNGEKWAVTPFTTKGHVIHVYAILIYRNGGTDIVINGEVVQL